MEHLKPVLVWLAEPDNLMLVLAVVGLVLRHMGYREKAARLEQATAVVGAVVAGVRELRRTGVVDAAALAKITEQAEAAGVEADLAAIVARSKDTAEKAGGDVLDAAKSVLAPAAKPLTARFLPRSAKALLGIVGALLLVALLAGCGAPPEAVDQADAQVGLNLRHAENKAIPREARLVGLDNADAWAEQRRALTDHDVSPPLRTKLEAVRLELEGGSK